MKCCRYMKFDHARLSLCDNLFKISKLSEFNDPSECRVRFFNSGDVPALRNYIHTHFQQLKDKYSKVTGDYSRKSQDILTEDFMYEGMLKKAEEPHEANKVYAFPNQIRAMCLVKEEGLGADTDTLFWSHYADSGKGIRITFDFPERDVFYYLKEVEYVDEVPAFDLSSLNVWMEGRDIEKYVEAVVCTKGAAWRYENEVRMIVPYKLPPEVPQKKHIFRKTIKNKDKKEIIECVNIDYDVITRVDFGPRANMDNVADLVNALQNTEKAAHIKCFKVDFVPDKYRYQYRRILCE